MNCNRADHTFVVLATKEVPLLKDITAAELRVLSADN